jgi:hypothetical protein
MWLTDCLTNDALSPPFQRQLIYTGGGTKSAVIRMLVEGLLHDGGKGPLINAEALSNDKVRCARCR